MNRLAIFLFWDKDGIMRDYVFYYLNGLSEVCNDILVVSNGELTDESRNKLFANCNVELLERENKGFDVWGYKIGLEYLGWDKICTYDELVITNYTAYGPVYPFSEMFKEMMDVKCDFWGAVKHPEQPDYLLPNNKGYIYEHIMSYFLIVRHDMLCSEQFISFWDSVPMIKKKNESIGLFETQFTKEFENMGFVSASYVDLSRYEGRCYNYSIFLADELLLKSKCPLVKRRAFYFPEYDGLLLESSTFQMRGLINKIKNHTEYDVNFIWDDLLQTQKMSSLISRMHLSKIIESYSDSVKETYIEKKVLHVIYIPEKWIAEVIIKYLDKRLSEIDVVVLCPQRLFSYCELFFEGVVKKVYRFESNDNSLTLNGLCCVEEIYKEYDYICCVLDYNFIDSKLTIGAENMIDYIFSSLIYSHQYVNRVIELFENDERLGFIVPSEVEYGKYYAHQDSLYNNGALELYRKIYEEMMLSVPFDDGIYTNGEGAFWVRRNVLEDVLYYIHKYKKELSKNKAMNYFLPIIIQQSGYYTITVSESEQAAVNADTNHYFKHKFINHIQNEYGVKKWTAKDNIYQHKVISRVEVNKQIPSREEILDTHFSFRELISLVLKYPNHKMQYLKKENAGLSQKNNVTTYLNGVFVEQERLVLMFWSKRENFDLAYVLCGYKKYFSKKNLSPEQLSLVNNQKDYYNANIAFFELPLSKTINNSISMYSMGGRRIFFAWGHDAIPYNALELREKELFSRIENYESYIIQDEDSFVKAVRESEYYSSSDKKLFNKLYKNNKHNIVLMAENLNAGDNSFELFKYALNHGEKNVFYVVSNNIYQQEDNPEIKKHMVVHNSSQHHRLLELSNKWIGSYSLSLELLPTDGKYKDIHMNFIPAKWYFIPHGMAVGDKDVSMLSHWNWGNPFMTFTNSLLERDAYADMYGFKNVVSLGSPRMDKWYNGKLEKQIIIFFTWRMGLTNHTVQKEETFIDSEYVKIALEVVFEVLKTKKDYEVFYVFHHEVEKAGIDKYIKSVLEDEKINYIYFSEVDGIRKFNNAFRDSRILITDFSSVAYDFAYKKSGKVIYYLQEEFIKYHYTLLDKFYDIQLGVIAKNIDELRRELLIENVSKEEEKRREDFFFSNDNHNTERVYNAIFKQKNNLDYIIKNSSEEKKNVYKPRRLNIFFFFDEDGIVDEYVFYYLENLIPCCEENCVVVNGNIRTCYKNRLDELVDKVIIRENVGYDSWAYREAMLSYGYDYISNNFDELILNNYTNFGPFYPFEEMFEEMDSRICDLWGHCRYVPEKNNKIQGIATPEHLMSYFLVFKESVLKSNDFINYWNTLEKPKNYTDAIMMHELRCTEYFEKKGYITDAFIPEYSYPDYCWNLPVYMAYSLLQKNKTPLIKRKAFAIEDGKFRYPLFGKETVYDLVKLIHNNTDYNTDLILNNIRRTWSIDEDTSVEDVIKIKRYAEKLKNDNAREDLINREYNKIYSKEKFLNAFNQIEY